MFQGGDKMDKSVIFKASSFSSQHTLDELKTANGYDLLNPVVNLVIEINSEKFFEEPYFPVLEFLQQVMLWKEQSSDFYYNSLEAEEDNPLISFVSENGLFRIHSPWQKFKCNELFSKDDILQAIMKIDIRN